MAKQLGEEATNRKTWDDHTVMTQLDSISNGDLALVIDCGYDDFFFDVNNKLHEALRERGMITRCVPAFTTDPTGPIRSIISGCFSRNFSTARGGSVRPV